MGHKQTTDKGRIRDTSLSSFHLLNIFGPTEPVRLTAELSRQIIRINIAEQCACDGLNVSTHKIAGRRWDSKHPTEEIDQPVEPPEHSLVGEVYANPVGL